MLPLKAPASGYREGIRRYVAAEDRAFFDQIPIHTSKYFLQPKSVNRNIFDKKCE